MVDRDNARTHDPLLGDSAGRPHAFEVGAHPARRRSHRPAARAALHARPSLDPPLGRGPVRLVKRSRWSVTTQGLYFSFKCFGSLDEKLIECKLTLVDFLCKRRLHFIADKSQTDIAVNILKDCFCTRV